MMKRFFFLPVFALVLASCTGEKDNNGNDSIPETPPKPRIAGPAFSADSAYAFIQQQVNFGPRVPGTKEHALCAAWIQEKMKSYGLTVTLQEGEGTMFNGKKIPIKNIMASFNPGRNPRVLLLAHWDSRFAADRDTADKDKPILGANDGASGVAVLMEIGRILKQKDPNIGVDLLFVDSEDQGQPNDDKGQPVQDSWCLGAQYWAGRIPQGYAPRYGVLLDMVGGKGAVFPREGTSVAYAPWLVDKVWTNAAQLGYGGTFVQNQTGQTVDDHYYINAIGNIPCIDIVHYDPMTTDYGPFHHRHSDNMELIDINTLKIVGHVLTDLLYNEEPAQ